MPEYSPILAAVTGAFEVLAAVYTLTGPGRKRILRPVGLILLLLAGISSPRWRSARIPPL